MESICAQPALHFDTKFSTIFDGFFAKTDKSSPNCSFTSELVEMGDRNDRFEWIFVENLALSVIFEAEGSNVGR